MEAIFINRVLSNEEEADILSRLSSGNSYTLYSNVKISKQLSSFSKGTLELSPKEKKKINYDIFEKVIQFGEIKINGEAITDLLMIEKASIWHYHKFRIYFYIRNLFFEIDLLEKLGKTHKNIFYYTDQSALTNFHFSAPEINIFPSTPTSSKSDKLSILNYLLFCFLRIIISLNPKRRLKNKKHIIIDHSIKQTCLNLNTLKPEQGNYNLQYLFEKLDDDFIILDDVEIPKFKKGNRFHFNMQQISTKGNRFFGETVLFSGIISNEARRQTKRSVDRIGNNLNLIKKELHHSIDLLIIDHLLSLQKSNKLFLFKYFAYKRFFKKYSFKTISSIDENSPRIKSILDAAKSSKVKTIGIQHGTIHDLHPAYVYSENDKKREIVPEHTIVWGKYWAEFLQEKGNYPKASLFISGQIRTDIIPRLIKSKINIPSFDKNKKLILYASQFQRDPEIRKQAAIDIFNSVKNIPAVLLVIKLHPSELHEFDFYHALGKQVGCVNYKITYWTDLYQLISNCDIISTCFSTVGTEAVYFNKPLIIIDHLKQDIQNYFKNGVAFQTSNSKELEQCIRKIIDKKIRINTAAYQNFISTYALKIDGAVSNRIIQFIKKLD
jgi:hypothetical protein